MKRHSVVYVHVTSVLLKDLLKLAISSARIACQFVILQFEISAYSLQLLQKYVH